MKRVAGCFFINLVISMIHECVWVSMSDATIWKKVCFDERNPKFPPKLSACFTSGFRPLPLQDRGVSAIVWHPSGSVVLVVLLISVRYSDPVLYRPVSPGLDPACIMFWKTGSRTRFPLKEMPLNSHCREEGLERGWFLQMRLDH